MNLAIHPQVDPKITQHYIDNGHLVTLLDASLSDEDYYEAIWNSQRVIIINNDWTTLFLAVHCHKEIHWINPSSDILNKLIQPARSLLNITYYTDTENYIHRTFLTRE